MDNDADKNAIDSIVETLTEKLYAHDYLITREEAKTIGLKVSDPTEDVDDAMWELFLAYEDYLGINQSVDFGAVLGPQQQSYYCVDSGIIESEALLNSYCYRGLIVRRNQSEIEFQNDRMGWEET